MRIKVIEESGALSSNIYYHTSPACLVLMRAELAVMRHNAARWRWAVITDYGDVFVEPCC